MQATAPAPTGVDEGAPDQNTPVNEKIPATFSVENLLAEWKAGRQEWLIMISFVLISLIAATDATILVTALPVSNIALSKCRFV